jgi:hypothetical protein
VAGAPAGLFLPVPWQSGGNELLAKSLRETVMTRPLLVLLGTTAFLVCGMVFGIAGGVVVAQATHHEESVLLALFLPPICCGAFGFVVSCVAAASLRGPDHEDKPPLRGPPPTG